MILIRMLRYRGCVIKIHDNENWGGANAFQWTIVKDRECFYCIKGAWSFKYAVETAKKEIDDWLQII